MSGIYYFQRFSQKENVVTNNTLLLFSRFYHYNTIRFQDFLSDLFGNVPGLQVGPQFEQQVRNKGSIPDGMISQTSFKVVIETKLYGNYNKDQIIQHLNKFENEDLKILLLIDPHPVGQGFIKNVKQEINTFKSQTGKDVLFIPSTFETIIKTMRDHLLDQDYEMQEILEEYEAFCSEENLLPDNNYLMKAVPCGFSLQHNLKYNIYYDPITRSYRNYKYLGLYNLKTIKAIGEIRDVITADYDFNTKKLEVKEHLNTNLVSPDDEEAIKGIIEDTMNELNIDLSKGQKFYMVYKFYDTNYRKTSKLPLRGGKYFDLKEIIGDKLPSAEKIAEILKEMSWE